MTRFIQRLGTWFALVLVAGVLAAAPRVLAADGTWTQTASGGLWSNSANWAGGNIANGQDGTADFSTLNLTAGNTARLDSTRTIGNLVFGDTTPSHNWGLDNNGVAGNILTLSTSVGTPAITINNQEAFISTVLDGTQGYVKAGPGALRISGTNTYTGVTTINEGTVIVQNNSAFGSTAQGTTVASGATINLGGTLPANSLAIGAEVFTISGTGVGGLGAIVSGNQSQVSGIRHLVLAADATISSTNRWDIRGVGSTASGNFKLTKIGSGNVSLLAVVSIKDIDVVQGTLGFTGGGNINNSNPGFITVYNAATLLVDSFGGGPSINKPIILNAGGRIQTGAASASGNATIAAGITLNAANTIQALANSVLTLNGVISGVGTYTPDGAGAVVLGNANIFTGNSRLIAGSTWLNNVLALQNSTLDMNAADSGVLVFSSALINATLGGLTGSRNLTLENAVAAAVTLSVGNNAADTTYSGNLGGLGSLNKIGAGDLKLTGTANNHSGGTTVTAGTLLVSNASGSGAGTGTVNVNGGVLGGTGFIAAPVSVNIGGVLAPGESTGILTVNNNVAFAFGSNFQVELNGTTPGTLYDRLVVNGTVNLGNATLNTTINYFADPNHQLFILVNDDTDAIVGTFDGLADGSQFLVGAVSSVPVLARISYFGDSALNSITGGNDVVLYDFELVPEPASLALLAVGSLLAWTRKRRFGGSNSN